MVKSSTVHIWLAKKTVTTLSFSYVWIIRYCTASIPGVWPGPQRGKAEPVTMMPRIPDKMNMQCRTVRFLIVHTPPSQIYGMGLRIAM